MKIKLAFLALVLLHLACGNRKGAIDPAVISGKYYSNEHSGDTILVRSDGTYLYTHHSSRDGAIDSVSGSWEYRADISSIFFKDFQFYSDAGASDHSGTWPPEVFLTNKGKVAIKYSDDVSYIRIDEK